MVFFSSRISPLTSTVIFFDRSPLATAVVTSAMLRTWLVRFAGHEVHVIGQIFPGAGDAFHLRLAAEFSFGTDFAGHAGDFRGERVELIHHGVDGVLELQNFAFDVDRDFLREVAVRHGRGHFRDIAHLAVRFAGHEVHVVGEILPGTGHAFHFRLAAEFSFGTDFAGHARDFRGEGGELIHHGVDGVLELENFAFHVDRDLLGEIAVGDGRGHCGDVAHLAGEV